MSISAPPLGGGRGCRWTWKETTALRRATVKRVYDLKLQSLGAIATCCGSLLEWDLLAWIVLPRC